MQETNSSKLHLSNLQAEIAHKIMALAQEEYWQAGDHVSEIPLSEVLGTSRTPVRRVLTVLEQRGVFRKVSNVGFLYVGLPENAQSIEQILPKSEADILYDKVVSARAKGEIQDEVSEAELASHFSTTRGLIRRVLMRFANVGLAERRTGHGWRFAETLDNSEAIDASYSFRIIIECGALRDPTFSPKVEQIRELQAQQKRLRDTPVSQISGSEWFEANAHFHAVLVSWAKNRFLSEAIERQNSLRRMTEVAEFTELSAERIRKAARDHLDILAAIEAGELETAAEALYRHLSRTPVT